MGYKLLTIILLIILAAVVVLGIKSLAPEKEVTPPLPTPIPMPSFVPTTESPREIKKDEKVEYQKASVEIRSFTAIPNVLRVKPNTIVTWTNFDKEPHQVVGDQWKSRSLKEKERFSQAFEKPGNFQYKDPSSPQLTGVVIVEE